MLFSQCWLFGSYPTPACVLPRHMCTQVVRWRTTCRTVQTSSALSSLIFGNDPMKRILSRLLAVSVILVMGTIAIVQALRDKNAKGIEQPTHGLASASSTVETGEPNPIPVLPDNGNVVGTSGALPNGFQDNTSLPHSYGTSSVTEAEYHEMATSEYESKTVQPAQIQSQNTTTIRDPLGLNSTPHSVEAGIDQRYAAQPDLNNPTPVLPQDGALRENTAIISNTSDHDPSDPNQLANSNSVGFVDNESPNLNLPNSDSTFDNNDELFENQPDAAENNTNNPEISNTLRDGAEDNNLDQFNSPTTDPPNISVITSSEPDNRTTGSATTAVESEQYITSTDEFSETEFPEALSNSTNNETNLPTLPADLVPTPESVGATSQALTSGTPLEGNGKPGEAKLEGQQTPTLVVEKIAPTEIHVGKPVEFTVHVRNTGRVDAHDVVIYDTIPQGTRLVETKPAATRATDGSLKFQLGTIQPGQEAIATIELMPLVEGEIGSVASVTFQTEVSVRTVATKPVLVIEHNGPKKALVGEEIPLTITISNPGTGTATGVILEEDVPEGVEHPAGSSLEFEIGDLKPGESRELDLILTATKAGSVENIIRARADANIFVEDRQQFEVVAPKLQVSMRGPTRRYLERQATYTIAVANPGTAAAHQIELVAHLPKGMKFVEANNQGEYDPAQHAIYWSLEELPPAQMGSVKLTTLPIEIGEQRMRIESRADMGLTDAHEHSVSVAGVSSLFFEVADSADPIEVGKETIYEIRLVNEGSKVATNVRLIASVPNQMQILNGDGPTRGTVEGQHIQFQPLTQLEPGGEQLYRIQVQGKGPGDHRIRVQVASDDMATPITREESTQVYADE